jgi:hypothetical protein
MPSPQICTPLSVSIPLPLSSPTTLYNPSPHLYTLTYLFHNSQNNRLPLVSVHSLLKSCTAKCIDTSYREADLNKGESVCLDRCVAKFFEVNVKVSEKMQGEAQGRQGGGGGGMFGGM